MTYRLKADTGTGWAIRALLAVAFVCFGWVAWVTLDTAITGWQLDAALQEATAPPVRHAAMESAPAWGELAEGDAVGRITSERLGISAAILHGVKAPTLRRAVGHIPGTARPGEAGNVGLAGHRDTFFRGLAEVTEGDRLALTTSHGNFEYQVDSTSIVTPDAVHVLDAPESGEVLTLVTCYPFYFVGPAPERFIVHATRVTAAGDESSGAGTAHRAAGGVPGS